MITIQEIEKLAELSRIALDEDEKKSLWKDIGSILGYVSEIQKVGGRADAGKRVGKVKNVMREDSDPHAGGIFTEEILRNAPSREGNYLKVKKIL
jgi:aspartyl-tRNA(Asn)/glutamyl-tRNA(Gln) amidotransferase subunit C